MKNYIDGKEIDALVTIQLNREDEGDYRDLTLEDLKEVGVDLTSPVLGLGFVRQLVGIRLKELSGELTREDGVIPTDPRYS